MLTKQKEKEKKKDLIHNIRGADLQTPHCGPDLLNVPHGYNIRFKHLCDQTEPVWQFSGCLVEVSGCNGLWRMRSWAVGLLAHQSDRLHGRGHRRH